MENMSVNRTVSEETHFLRLFKEARDIIGKTMDIHPEEFEYGIDIIVETFKHYYKENGFSGINFNMSGNLYAYFYRVSPIAFALTRDRILDGLNHCEEFANKCSSTQVNIVSIGCGPGSDIVGLCSALSKMPFRKMKLTLVDTVKRWSSFFNILEFLMREGEFGCASDLFHRVDISTTFLCEDVSLQHVENTAYFPALREADIILMKDVFTIVPFPEMNTIKRNIVKAMKPSALLLYIDSYYYGFDDLEILYTKYNELRFPQEPFKIPINDGSKLTDFYSLKQLENSEEWFQKFQEFSKSQLVILTKQNHDYD